jgi:antitoxin ParD1/3/4
MANILISLPDELVNYLDQKVTDKSIFIASILQKWRQQQEAEELAQACLAVDELELGWTDEWQTAAIIDSEASGL